LSRRNRHSSGIGPLLWPLLAVVAFGVLLGVVLYTQDDQPGDEPEQQAIEPLWDRAQDEVATVSPSFIDTDAVEIGRRDGTFWITNPRELPAAYDDSRRLFGLLARPEPLRVVEDDASDRLGEFGLDNPYGVVSVTFNDGEAHELLIGDPSPVSQGETPNRYIMETGASTVYVYSGVSVDFMNRPLEEWRERDVLRLDLDTVGHVDIWQGEESANSFQLERREAPADGFQWLVTAPDFAGPASTQTVRSFISAFDRVEVYEFLEDDGPSQADLELDPGYMRFVFTGDEGANQSVLRIGKFADNKGQTVYAANDEWPFPFIIETKLFGEAPPSPWNVLEKSVFSPVSYAKLKRLAWESSDGHAIDLMRLSVEGAVSDTAWKLTVDGSDQADVDGETVSDLARKVLATKAADFRPMTKRAEHGHEPPAGTLTAEWVSGDDQTSAISLVLGTPVDENTRYAAIEGYEGLYQLSEKQVNEILEAFENLTD